MNKIGVIDIGSNSVHLVVADCNTAKGHFTILDDAKVNVRLCEGLSETGLLREDRMVLGVETLEMFKSMCDAYHVDQMEAVATAAVRKADNGGEFVRRVQEACGVAIKVIPGETEAAMDYLGTVNTIDVTDALLMDIGGGSVEFVRIADRRKVDAISLPFGSIDLMERFGLGDEADPKKIAQLEAFIEGALIGQPMFKAARHLPVLGVGGTIRNIGRIHRRMTDYPLEIAHNYVMTADEVASVCREADELDLEGRKNLKGLSSGRSDIFVGASHAVLKVLDFIGSDQLIISDAGLRDGVLFNEFGKGEDHLVPDVFEASLSRAVDNLGVEAGHARHVCNLARQLLHRPRAPAQGGGRAFVPYRQGQRHAPRFWHPHPVRQPSRAQLLSDPQRGAQRPVPEGDPHERLRGPQPPHQ